MAICNAYICSKCNIVSRSVLLTVIYLDSMLQMSKYIDA